MSMLEEDDLDELLGGPVEAPKPVRDHSAVGDNWGDPNKKEVSVLTVESHLNDVLTGVSIPFLVQIFGKGRKTINDALEGVKPIKIGQNGARYYNLAEAAEHLVTGKKDLERYVRRMSPSELPDQLKVEYWSAKNKQIDYEERTGQLWRVEAVIGFLEHMFEIVKTRSILFPDRLDEQFGFTPAMRKVAEDLVRGMNEEIFEDITELKKKQRTASILEEQDDEE